MIYKLDDMDALYKFLALKLSDRVSSQLKINFDLKDVTCLEGTYTDVMQHISSFCYVGLMSYFARGVLLAIDPKIIYMLSNRMLGGKGHIEEKSHAHFTLSEKVFGEQLLNWMTDFYKELHVPVTYVRSEENLSHVHYFYSDETVFGAMLKCRINEKVVGYIVAVHPMMEESDAHYD